MVVDTPALGYRLGLPAWAHGAWQDLFFHDKPSRLASYATVFNTVEGNTSFYHVPDRKTVDAWARAVELLDFQISFKLPRSVTHQSQPDLADLKTLLTNTAVFGKNLGPFLLQFPEWVELSHLRKLKPVFDMVSMTASAVIEVRNQSFFNQPSLLEPLLGHYGFGRVILDSRPLYKGNVEHPEVVAAIHEKPDLPVLYSMYSQQILVRLILHPDGISNAHWIDVWARQTANWIDEGLVPCIMIHCPNNLHCPLFAEQFHREVRRYANVKLPALPPWPVPRQGQLL